MAFLQTVIHNKVLMGIGASCKSIMVYSYTSARSSGHDVGEIETAV
jgi:hypothetical protein